MTIVGTAEIELKPHTSNFAKDAAKAIAVAGVGLTAAAAGFIAKSEHTFADVGAQVKQLTRLTGVSAESASVLRVQANAVGVDVDTLGRSIVLLSKNIELHGDKVKGLGVDYQDARGRVLPMDQILGNVAEKFANMPDGIAKNTLAVQLFGKSGTQLLPFLNKGKAGLGELSDEAHKFGLVLSQDNLDALKKNTIAHRQFHDALEGVELTMGRAVMPVMTEFTVALNQLLFPALASVSGFITRTFGPSLQKAFDAAVQLGRALFTGDFRGGPFTEDSFVVDVIFRIREALQKTYDVAMQLGRVLFTGDFRGGPFAEDSPVVAAIFRFREILGELYGYIERDVYPHIADAWHAVGKVFDDVATAIATNAGPVFNAALDAIRIAVDSVSSFIHDTAWPRIEQVYNWLKEKLDPVAKFIRGAFDKIKDKVLTDLIPALRDKLVPVIRDDVPKALEGMVNFIKNNVLPIMGSLATAAGVTVAVQIGNMIGSIGGAVQGLSSLGFLISPVGLIGVGLAALAGGLIYAYQHSESFRRIVDETFTWLKINIPPIVEYVTAVVLDKFGSIVAFAQEVWPEISAIIVNTITFIKGQIEIVLAAIYLGWQLWGDDIYQWLKGFLDILAGLFKLGLDLLSGHWSKLWDDFLQVVNGIVLSITAVIGGIWAAISKVLGLGFDAAKKAWSDLWNDFWGVVSSVVASMERAIQGVLDKITDAQIKIHNDLHGGPDQINPKNLPPGVGKGPLPPSQFPKLHATGGIASGWAFTGDQGIELANYGSPSRIIPHDQIGSLLAQAGGSSVGGSTINIEINAPGATAQTIEALRVLARDEIANTINSVVRKATTGAGSK